MSGRAPLNRAAAGFIIVILAVVVLAADQFAKYLAVANLPSEQPVKILGDFLIFYLVRNAGAAFSLGTGVTWIFTVALVVVAIGIVALISRIRSRAWAIVLGLLLGGVLGNLTDRLFRPPSFGSGHVVDFISTPWMLPAIYNVADMFIVTMMISVALLVLIGLRLDGTRERRRNAVVAGEGETILAAEGHEPMSAGATQESVDSGSAEIDPDTDTDTDTGAPRVR